MAASARKGIVTFGLVSIPVELHVAARAETLDFDLLHRPCQTRIQYRLYCPIHKTEVSRKETVKAYKENGYVVLDDEDFEKARRAGSRAIEVVQFVDQAEVDPLYLERSYYVGPQEDGERPYEVLLRALQESNKAAVVRFVQSNRQQHALLRPSEDFLVLHTLYYADELQRFERDRTRARPAPAEVKLAEQYIEALTQKFVPEAFHDEYRETLKKIIRAKAEGQEVALPEAPKVSGKVVSLTDALRQSIQAARKPPARVAADTRSRTAHARRGRTRKTA
jgi:DNA end-binding protein Ku